LLQSPTGLPDPDYQAEFYDGVNTKRAIAWVIDVVIAGLATLVLLPFTAFIGLFFLPIFYGVVSFLYRWFTLSRSSATWGMQMTGIEIRQGNGDRLDMLSALLHTLAFTVSIMLVVPQVISVGLMVLRGRGQGLTDLFIGTAALKSPARYYRR